MKIKMKAKYAIIIIVMLTTISVFGNATALTTQTNDTNTGTLALTGGTIHVADVWCSQYDAPYAKVTLTQPNPLTLEIKSNSGEYFNFEVGYDIKAPGDADYATINLKFYDQSDPTGTGASKTFQWGGPEEERSGTIKLDQDQLLYPGKTYKVIVNADMYDWWGVTHLGSAQGILTINTKLYVPKPVLSGGGTIKGTNLKPTGSAPFNPVYVENVGESGSKLNWEITETPSFGTWSFTPASGNGLTTGTQRDIEVWLEKAPSEANKEFTGHVRIINKDNPSNYVDIPVDIKTGKKSSSETTEHAIHTLFTILYQRLLKMLFNISQPNTPLK